MRLLWKILFLWFHSQLVCNLCTRGLLICVCELCALQLCNCRSFLVQFLMYSCVQFYHVQIRILWLGINIWSCLFFPCGFYSSCCGGCEISKRMLLRSVSFYHFRSHLDLVFMYSDLEYSSGDSVEEAKASKSPASGDLRFQLCLIHYLLWLLQFLKI